MGKATRWLKQILGMKKANEYPDKKVKNRWSVGRLNKDSAAPVGAQFPAVSDSPCRLMSSYIPDSEKQNKRAIEVAAATAAKAAAEAAAAVVKLTSQGKGGLWKRENWAAVKIQTFFRGYLARKALRALKGIVKLQAMVRGYLVRRRAAFTLYCMQALIRAQAAFRSQTALLLPTSNDPRFVADARARMPIERFNGRLQRRISGPYDEWMDEKPKTVEIGTYKLKKSRTCWRRSTEVSDSGDDQNSLPCLIPGRLSIPDRRKLCDSEWSCIGEECKFPTAHNTPRTRRSGRGNPPPSPAKSFCEDSSFRPYSNCRSYMANTQSFNAKLRSQSAPKPRPEPRQKNRFSLNELMAAKSSISSVRKSCYVVQEEYAYLGV